MRKWKIKGAYVMQKLMTENEVADITGFKITTLRQWRYNGDGPRFIKIGRSVRYLYTDVEAWINAYNTEM